MSGHERRRAARRSVVAVTLALALVLAGGVAFAYWSTGSVAGGNGAAAATTMAQGATPTVTAANGGSTVVVGWAARTLATGVAVSGYQVSRYPTGDSTAQAMLSACTGTLTALTCTESDVPTGSWQYTVTPVVGTNWRGAESARSAAVVTDHTPPTSSITLSDQSEDAYRTGNTVYYRGSGAGSFTLTNVVGDAGSGPASSQTTALAGTTTGWSHTPSTVSTPVGGPFVSNQFTWTAGTSSSPTETVTAGDAGGNTTSTVLTFVDDSTGPGAGTLSYVDGSTGGTTNAVSFTTGADSGSGVGTRLLQRASAPLTGISCGTYTAFATTVGGTNPVSPFLDVVGADTCYMYRYVVSDNVGNTTTTTSTAVSHSPYGAHYRFDAGSGTTAVDSAGNGNTATLQPGAGWTAGRTGAAALDLDGSSASWASAPNPVIDSSQSFTVSGWVEFDALTGYQTLAAMDGDSISPFYLQRRGDSGAFAFTLYAGDSTSAPLKLVTGISPVTDTWYHLTGVFDQPAGTIQLYVNGVSQGTVTGASSFRAQGSTTIGRAKYGGNPVDLFDGALDEVRFYDRVLTAAEIATLADGSAPTGGSVDAIGLTGTGNRYSTSTTLSLAFDKGTDPSGLAATGNQLLRSAGTLSAGSCTGFGGYTKVGADDPVSPQSDTVPDGACYRYRYVVLDNEGNPATYTSGDIKVDTTAPTAPDLGFSGFTNTSSTGTTLFYRPAASSGGFTVTAGSTDPSSGIGSYSFPSLGTGWTSTAGAVDTNTYSWAAANPATPAGQSVTATSMAGTTSAGTPLTLTPDSTAPSAGTVSYADGSTSGTSVSVSFTTGVDAGSGVGTRLLQRASAPVTGTTCGTYDAFATVIGGTDPTSPVVDTIAVDTCNTYRYVAADKVGNTHTATSIAVAHTRFGAAYAFDAGSGSTAVDSTGNGNTATLEPGAGWTTGKVGAGALSLNGAGTSWASAPNPVIDSSQSYTVAGWVKLNSLSGFQTVASIDGSSVSPFYLQRIADGPFALSQFAGDSTSASVTRVTGLTPVAGTWYHLTGVFDQPAGTLRLYVNGVSQGTATGASSFRALGSTTIGRARYGGNPVDFLNGAIDDVRFYDRPLTGSEVAALADGAGPTNSITTSDITGGVAKTGDTVYYRGAEAGSFRLTNAVTDSGSGPASSSTSPLTGGTTGWTHTPSTVSSPAGGPYVSAPFSWTASSSGSPTEAVTGRDATANATTTNLSFVDDSTLPTGATVSYPDGFQTALSVDVSTSPGTDAGSGVGTRRLQRSSAVLAAGLCDTFGAFAGLGPEGPASPYTDSTVVDQRCYKYRYVVTDRVGNQQTATSSRVVKVDSGQGGPLLRSAASFSVLAGTGVVSTGSTSVSGDLGVSPSSSVTGFPPGIVSGDVHLNDAVAVQAQADLVSAYDDANGRTPTNEFVGDLGGRTFTAGVHHTTPALALTGTLTLDAQNDPNAVFVFQVDAAMNTAAGSNVALVNGAQASRVFWQVQGAVGMGANASLAGTILASGAVTLGDSAQVVGRALSYGTVTMAANSMRFTTAGPPTVTIAGGPTAVTKDTTPTLSGTTSAPAGTTVRVYVAGQTLVTTAAGDGSWSVTADTLIDGQRTVTAVVRDTNGNSGSATQTLAVEVNPAPVALRTSASYSVLATTGVANTGATTLAGDLGVTTVDTISGFPPGIALGTTHNADAAAVQAQADLVTAYGDANGRTPRSDIFGNLGGQTFRAGVYHSTAALALTGTVTLDAENNPDAVFIFQVDAAMNTAANANVVLANGAQAANVIWQAEGAVGTGAGTVLRGTILTAGAITLGDSTQLFGRALSRGTVTLANNSVS